RADLTSEYVCRLLNHMDDLGVRQATPRLRESDLDMPPRPWIDGFSSGYMQRVMHRFPKQGDREPWINPQNYSRDTNMIRSGALAGGASVSARAPPPARAAARRPGGLPPARRSAAGTPRGDESVAL